MSSPLERANRASEYTKKLNAKAALEAEIKTRRKSLQAYLDGPSEDEETRMQQEAAFANLDGETAEELEIQAKEQELATIDNQLAAEHLQIYTDRLVDQLELNAKAGQTERQEHVKWLRTRVAWASTAILGAIITLAASNKLNDTIGQAALNAIWYGGSAVAVAAAQRVLLILFYLAVALIAFAANRTPKYARAAPIVSGGMAASEWLPMILLAAEVTLMALAAWNLAVVLQVVIGS